MPFRRAAARLFPALPGLLLLLTTPAFAQPQSRARVDSALTAAYARFSDAYRRADGAAVAALYTADAFYLAPGDTIARGNAAVLANFQGFLGPMAERGEPGPPIEFEIVDRDVRGDLAYDVGYYRLGGGERNGKFIVVWKRGADGQWRIHADGFSAVEPPRQASAEEEGGGGGEDAGAAADVPAAELARYAGEYTSATPPMTVRVSAEGGALRMRAEGLPEVTLMPVGMRFRMTLPGQPPGAYVFFRVEGAGVSRLVLEMGPGQEMVLTPRP